MDKLKELWGKNKVLIVLGIVLIICLIAIIIVTISFFFGGSKSVYGNRLDDIDNYPITENFKQDYINNLESDESIEKVEFNNQGRIIYISIDYADDTALMEAESKATGSLQLFDEKLLSYYDINFTLTSNATDNSEGFIILGARNIAGSGKVEWNNNTPVESED